MAVDMFICMHFLYLLDVYASVRWCQILELLVQRDREFQDLMEVAQRQGKVHQEMQQLEKEVEKRDSDIQQLQKQLKEAEHILVRLSLLFQEPRLLLTVIMLSESNLLSRNARVSLELSGRNLGDGMLIIWMLRAAAECRR